MVIQNGITYESNYGRAAAYYLATCAPAPVGEERRRAYELIIAIYSAIVSDAAAIGYKPVPDVSFEVWEPHKGREKDIKYIRGAITKIEELIAELFYLAESVEIRMDGALLPEGATLGRMLEKVLCVVGVIIHRYSGRIQLIAPKGCFDGLRELATISRTHTIPIMDGPKEGIPYLYFSRCVFEPSENWIALAFDKMLGADGRLVWLCSQLEKRGYRRIDCYDGKRISLDYVKQHGKKEEPIKLPYAERTHSGINLSYEELKLEPGCLTLRMPMFKTILKCAQKLPENVVGFIERFTKTCDGCRFCVQMDKTHTRSLASVNMGEKNKCPYFPAFGMNWRQLPPELAEIILVLFDALDELAELA